MITRPMRFSSLRYHCLALAVAAFAGVSPAAPPAVDWHPWNAASFTAAREAGRSVYVFIDAPLSELSRTTREQTLSRPETVEWINANFFPILVDGDAHPGVAAYGQHFINTVKQLRGSPVHLWLTPDLLPYDGANYLPPSEEWGKPGFLKSARSALDRWTQNPDQARALAAEALALMTPYAFKPGAPVDADKRIQSATTAWLELADPRHHGFDTVPKLPRPELLRFLLQHREPGARDAALAAAQAMITSPLRDPADGGFYTRTIDEAWQEPYRQKLLDEQARIALALFDAADVAATPAAARAFRSAAEGALDFVLQSLGVSTGHYSAALDYTVPGSPTRVGVANTADLAWLLAALTRADAPRFATAADRLAQTLHTAINSSEGVEHIIGGGEPATATDLTALALAFRARRDDATADALLSTAVDRYFDAELGIFLAAPEALPPGIALRVPSPQNAVTAEALALLAGIKQETADPLRQGLWGAIEYEPTPAGDVLLALQPQP